LVGIIALVLVLVFLQSFENRSILSLRLIPNLRVSPWFRAVSVECDQVMSQRPTMLEVSQKRQLNVMRTECWAI